MEKSFKLSDSQLPFPLKGPQTCLDNRALGGGRTLAYYREYIYSILYITHITIRNLEQFYFQWAGEGGRLCYINAGLTSYKNIRNTFLRNYSSKIFLFHLEFGHSFCYSSKTRAISDIFLQRNGLPCITNLINGRVRIQIQAVGL